MVSNPRAQEAIDTARTWYQPKRIPLYIVVGATFAGTRSKYQHLLDLPKYCAGSSLLHKSIDSQCGMPYVSDVLDL